MTPAAAVIIAGVAACAHGEAPAAARPAPGDCDQPGSPAALCSDVRPAANPVALAGGALRLVFDGELPAGLGLGAGDTGCRVVDVDAGGAHLVAAGCCSPGVIAAALDQDDRFYVLCARGDGDGLRFTAQRLEPGGRFTALPGSAAFAPVDPAGHGREAHGRGDRLLVAGRTAVVVHDVAIWDGPSYEERTFVQPLRGGAAAAVDSDGALVAYYAIGDALYGVGALRGGTGAVGRFELGIPPRALGALPDGAASSTCAAWSGAAMQPGRPLALQLVQRRPDDPPEGRAVTVAIPHGRAVPTATSRGPAPPLCNGAARDPRAALELGGETVAGDAIPASAVASCGPASCVVAFTTRSDGVGERFHLRRIARRP